MFHLVLWPVRSFSHAAESPTITPFNPLLHAHPAATRADWCSLIYGRCSLLFIGVRKLWASFHGLSPTCGYHSIGLSTPKLSATRSLSNRGQRAFFLTPLSTDADRLSTHLHTHIFISPLNGRRTILNRTQKTGERHTDYIRPNLLLFTGYSFIQCNIQTGHRKNAPVQAYAPATPGATWAKVSFAWALIYTQHYSSNDSTENKIC